MQTFSICEPDIVTKNFLRLVMSSMNTFEDISAEIVIEKSQGLHGSLRRDQS